MEVNGIEIIRVEVDRIIDLRHRVLREGMPRESARFEGDAAAIHLAAIVDAKVVGCATVMMDEQHACKLRGMAVDQDYQRRGVGRMLLAEVELVAAELGVSLIWANCRKPAVEFYEKAGWDVISAEFDIPTAGPHFKMARRL